MVLRKHRSPDVPDYDYYPSDSPRAQATGGEADLETQPVVEGRLVRESSEFGVLERAARALANAPRAVARRLTIVSRGQAKGAAADLTETAQEKLEEARHFAAVGVEAVRNSARGAWESGGEVAQQTWQATRAAAERAWSGTRSGVETVRRDYPLQAILAAGAVGFLLGAALRLGRRPRYAGKW